MNHGEIEWPVPPNTRGSAAPRIFALMVILLLMSGAVSFLPSCLLPEPGIGSARGENQAPIAEGGNITEEEPGNMVFFSALGSHDPDGEIVFFEWDFDGDGTYDWNSTENGTTEYSFKDEGVYNATLRVTDNNGTSTTDTHYVFILEKEETTEETDYDRIRAVLTIVGILEILAGVGIFAVILYLKRKLYDVL
jgi:hypothetical protein